MGDVKLFMVLIGCKPTGRHTEQHDVFFGIGESLKTLLPQMQAFWKEAKGKIHIDAWREVKHVDGYDIAIMKSAKDVTGKTNEKLFFINLGGYKKNELEEYHYKILTVAPDKGKAVQQSKQSAFYKHCGFKGATSHIDDKYGIDVDDLYAIEDVLPVESKEKYYLHIIPSTAAQEDELHIGYLKIDKLT